MNRGAASFKTSCTSPQGRPIISRPASFRWISRVTALAENNIVGRPARFARLLCRAPRVENPLSRNLLLALLICSDNTRLHPATRKADFYNEIKDPTHAITPQPARTSSSRTTDSDERGAAHSPP